MPASRFIVVDKLDDLNDCDVIVVLSPIENSLEAKKAICLPLKWYQDIQLLQLYKILRLVNSLEGKIGVYSENKENARILLAGHYLYNGLGVEESSKRAGVEWAGILKALDKLLLIQDPALDAVLNIGEKYEYGWGIEHASKVTQLTIILWEFLKDILSLNSRSLIPLILAAILHDIGRKLDDETHHERTAELFDKHKAELLKHFDEKTIKLAKRVAYHHRNVTEPEDEFVARLASILRVADGLDHTLNQSVEDVVIVNSGRVIQFTVLCRGLCEASVMKAEKKSALLRKITGRKVEFKIVHPSSL